MRSEMNNYALCTIAFRGSCEDRTRKIDGPACNGRFSAFRDKNPSTHCLPITFECLAVVGSN